jgi:hypothetical protein
MNSFYWFHLLFLVILLLPVLSFLFTLRKPLRRSLLTILLVQAGGILLYLLCMPPLYWVCAQADFSHFYGIPDFLRQDSAILLVPVYDSIFLTAGFCLIRWIVEEVRRRKR